jgi:hypothetical protein
MEGSLPPSLQWELSTALDVQQRPSFLDVLSGCLQKQLLIEFIEHLLDVKLRHPRVFPASLASDR